MNSKYLNMPIHSHNNKEIYISACSSDRIQFKKYSVFTNHNISLDCHSDQLRTMSVSLDLNCEAHSQGQPCTIFMLSVNAHIVYL